MRALWIPMTALGLAACANDSPPVSPQDGGVAAAALEYTDPPASGWRLVRNASSTATRLVLDLVGPSDVATRGVGFNLQAPAAIHYGVFENGLPINDAGLYELKSPKSMPGPEALAIIGGVQAGNLLTVGIYQKDRDVTAKLGGRAACQIALELDLSAGLHAGDAIEVAVPKAKAIPADNGAPGDDTWTLRHKLVMTDVKIAVGALKAR
jgi:hypothetical protein